MSINNAANSANERTTCLREEHTQITYKENEEMENKEEKETSIINNVDGIDKSSLIHVTAKEPIMENSVFADKLSYTNSKGATESGNLQIVYNTPNTNHISDYNSSLLPIKSVKEPQQEEMPAIRPEYSREFLETDGVSNLPDHLLPLAHEIHLLEPHDLALIADVAYTVASRDVYSLLPYTGSNWYLPSIRECHSGEPHWEIHYNWRDGLIIAIGGRRLSIKLFSIVIRIALIILTWFMMWNILPHWLVEPGGYVWDPLILVVVSSLVGGLLCRILQIPPLVGVLWIGIMWNNIPTLRYLTSGIDKHVFDIASKLGLTVILLRAGYSTSWKSIKPHWKQSCMLATLPFAFEGVAHSLIANKVFKYNNNYNWAFLQGMLCSIASPAVVVPGALYLQQLGYGRKVGPLTLMLSAVGVEIGIGVWCANFIIGLIFYNQKLAVAIVLGPVQFIGGAVIGVLIGVIYFYVVEVLKNEAHRLPSGKFQREHFRNTLNLSYVIMLCASFAMVFLGYGVSLAGGGCVMAMAFAATVAHMWLKDGKRELEEQKKYIAGWLAFTWDHIMLPLLFATMGAKIDIKAIFNSDFFPKAIICLVCSTCCRLIVILLVQLGDGMSWKDKAVVCMGYLGKASAQASIGPIAANLVLNLIAEAPTSEVHKYDQMKEYANNVQQMSALYVMFMAAIASVSLVRGGQLLMEKTNDASNEHKSDLTSSSSSSSSSSLHSREQEELEEQQRIQQQEQEELEQVYEERYLHPSHHHHHHHHHEEQEQEQEEIRHPKRHYCAFQHKPLYENNAVTKTIRCKANQHNILNDEQKITGNRHLSSSCTNAAYITDCSKESGCGCKLDCDDVNAPSLHDIEPTSTETSLSATLHGKEESNAMRKPVVTFSSNAVEVNCKESSLNPLSPHFKPTETS